MQEHTGFAIEKGKTETTNLKKKEKRILSELITQNVENFTITVEI